MPSLSLACKGYLSTYMPTLYVANHYNLLLFQSIPENGGGKIRQRTRRKNMSSGLGYGLAGILGLALGLGNARKQSQQDALLEAQLRGPGTWEPMPDVDRSFFAKMLSAGLPQDV